MIGGLFGYCRSMVRGVGLVMLGRDRIGQSNECRV